MNSTTYCIVIVVYGVFVCCFSTCLYHTNKLYFKAATEDYFLSFFFTVLLYKKSRFPNRVLNQNMFHLQSYKTGTCKYQQLKMIDLLPVNQGCN